MFTLKTAHGLMSISFEAKTVRSALDYYAIH